MALAITRKPNESVQIGDATVHVDAIRGGRVRLRIEAPADIRILRTEKVTQSNPEQPVEDLGSACLINRECDNESPAGHQVPAI